MRSLPRWSQRWTIAHLHQSVLDGQPHVPRLARLQTLAGHVHWRLTGEHVVGLDEASGMFPIDPATRDWDAARMAAYELAGRMQLSAPQVMDLDG